MMEEAPNVPTASQATPPGSVSLYERDETVLVQPFQEQTHHKGLLLAGETLTPQSKKKNNKQTPLGAQPAISMVLGCSCNPGVIYISHSETPNGVTERNLGYLT